MDFYETSTIQINKKLFQLTEEYIEKRLQKNEKISYKETIDEIVAYCQREIQFGSRRTIREKIEVLCSKEGPFEKIMTKNIGYIRMRIFQQR